MRWAEHPLYTEDLEKTTNLPLPWERLNGAKVVISGATGSIGGYLTDTLMTAQKRLGCQVIALGRNSTRAMERFIRWKDSKAFSFIACDLNKELPDSLPRHVDYVIHAASNTHPLAYATDPIGTIVTNVVGTKNLLDYAVLGKAKRFVFASSVEVYGENRGDTEFFSEDYCGYINCNSLRAGYPESKRCGEALCQAYGRQNGIDFVIPRLSRTYGPTTLRTDTKAVSQFLFKGLTGDDIILKSEGNQLYSYTYVSDAVSGLLTCMLCGNNGEAYNVADQNSNIKLRDLADLIAKECCTNVVYQLPEKTEAAGYSTATKAIMAADQLKALGWKPEYDIQSGISRTLRILKDTT